MDLELNKSVGVKDKFMQIKDVVAGFDKNKFEQQDTAAIIREDLTQNLYQQLYNQFIANVQDIESFQLTPLYRKTYLYYFDAVLKSWNGNFKLCLLNNLEHKINQYEEESVDNPYLKWYQKDVLPTLADLAL